MQKKKIFSFTTLTLSVLLFATTTFSQSNSTKQNKSMKITNNQQAPDFQVQDVYGKSISLSAFKGKKILLSFFRNAGCPVCNLRFHKLETESGFLKSNNVVFIAVYASDKDNMLDYLNSSYPDSSSLYPIFIANTDRSLYNLYDLERSTGKLIKSLLFHGGLSDVSKGKKLYKSKIKDDSPKNMIGADFLIDETGKVITAYYGKYSGDFIPIEMIKSFAIQN